MNVYTKNQIYCVIGWAFTFLGALVIVYFLTACTPSPVPPTETPCLPDIKSLENESVNCNEAQIKVDVLLRYSATCHAIFGDAGFNVCGKVGKDAGHD